MDQEAQGIAGHSCMPSNPAVRLHLGGCLWSGLPSQLWDGEHYTEGSTGEPPPPPQQQPGLTLSLLPGTCLPQTLFPALKAES